MTPPTSIIIVISLLGKKWTSCLAIFAFSRYFFPSIKTSIIYMLLSWAPYAAIWRLYLNPAGTKITFGDWTLLVAQSSVYCLSTPQNAFCRFRAVVQPMMLPSVPGLLMSTPGLGNYVLQDHWVPSQAPFSVSFCRIKCTCVLYALALPFHWEVASSLHCSH